VRGRRRQAHRREVQGNHDRLIPGVSASTHGLPTRPTRRASRKNAHQGAGGRRGCHGRAARRLARAGLRTGLEPPHGSRAKRPMTRGTRSASTHGLPTRLTRGVSRKNAHQGTGGCPGCHGRSALRIARAGLRTGLEPPHGSRAKRPMTRGTRSASTHGLPTRLTRGVSRKNAHQGTGGCPGCHGRSALRIARAGLRTGLEPPHGSSGEAPDDPWHPEWPVHGLPTHTTRGASRKNVHQGAGGRRGCHGRSALRIARASAGPASNSRTGHGRSAR